MIPTMNTRGDAWTYHGSTMASRRHAVQGLGALALAVLSLSSRRSSAAAQEATPAGGDPLANGHRDRRRPSTGLTSTTKCMAQPMDNRCCCCTAGSATPSGGSTYRRCWPLPATGSSRWTAAAMAAPLGVICRSPMSRWPTTSWGCSMSWGSRRRISLGWSDGAIIGLEIAVNHPERLDRVVAYGANYTPEGVHELVPSDQLLPFERLIADYQRLSPQPERFDELARSARRAVRGRAELQRGAPEEHHSAGPDCGRGRGGVHLPRAHGADGGADPGSGVGDHARHRPLRPVRATGGVQPHRAGVPGLGTSDAGVMSTLRRAKPVAAMGFALARQSPSNSPDLSAAVPKRFQNSSRPTIGDVSPLLSLYTTMPERSGVRSIR